MVLAVAGELMAGTRLESILTRAGHLVRMLEPDAAEVGRAVAAAGPGVVVIDLAVPAEVLAAAMAAARSAGSAVIAFGPHAQTETLAAARAAGAAAVLARGALERGLPPLVARELARLPAGGGMAGPGAT